MRHVGGSHSRSRAAEGTLRGLARRTGYTRDSRVSRIRLAAAGPSRSMSRWNVRVSKSRHSDKPAPACRRIAVSGSQAAREFLIGADSRHLLRIHQDFGNRPLPGGRLDEIRDRPVLRSGGIRNQLIGGIVDSHGQRLGHCITPMAFYYLSAGRGRTGTLSLDDGGDARRHRGLDEVARWRGAGGRKVRPYGTNTVVCSLTWTLDP